jgi:hypothetical protein
MLSDICDQFQREVEELDLSAEDYAAHLRRLIMKLVRDAAEHVDGYGRGEIPALMQRCHEALVALATEAEDVEDRQCRYQRQAGMLNLMVLADSIARFHAATHAQQRKSVDALRDLVADALAGLVKPEERTA